MIYDTTFTIQNESVSILDAVLDDDLIVEEAAEEVEDAQDVYEMDNDDGESMLDAAASEYASQNGIDVDTMYDDDDMELETVSTESVLWL